MTLFMDNVVADGMMPVLLPDRCSHTFPVINNIIIYHAKLHLLPYSTSEEL